MLTAGADNASSGRLIRAAKLFARDNRDYYRLYRFQLWRERDLERN